jgi:RNA polymerase sigma factor (sigma-70 family)
MKLVYKKDEQKILKGCVKGDPKAQEELYKRFSKTMFGVCLGYAKDYDLAKDLLQEGFIKVFHNIHKYNGKGSLEGWIRRVMLNNAIDYYRKYHRAAEFSEERLEDSEYNSIENDAIKSLDKDDFLLITKCLPNGYRMILNLYIVEGFTHKEIAGKLNISEGTSKSQLSKAKKFLLKTIKHYIDEETILTYERKTS